jgi:nitrogen-specific signal transduction histidine kinase
MPNKDPNAGGNQGLSFEHMLENSCTCGVLSVDAGGAVTFVSPEAEKILCLSRAEKSSSATKLPRSLQSLILEARTGGQSVIDRRIVLHQERSRSAAVSVTIMPASASERSGRLIVLLKDFHSTKTLEHNLRQLDRLASVGTLSAGMAHEIKNALVAVKTFVDLLLEKNKDDELAEVVRHEMSRMDSIVTRMLKFGAPARPSLATVSLHKILDHSLRLVQHRVEGRLISFDRQFQAASDLLNADDNQLEQAFVNLLLNAVEAINANGSLTVVTDLAIEGENQLREGESQKFVRIRISDTGSGITPENMARLFEPFFTTKQNGTGLGLAVTRRIIEEHHGTIHVESQPGKGTTFTVLLPGHLK